MKTTYLSPLAVIAIFLLSLSCNKGNNKVVPLVYDYTFKGCLCTANDIVFQSDSSLRSLAHAWDFGDGYTSSVASPSHSYTDTGTYTVSLIINGNTVRKMTKLLKIVKNPVYTSAACKSWNCTKYYRVQVSGATPTDNTTQYDNVNLQVTYVDPLTIKIEDDNLFYTDSLSGIGKVVFVANVQSPDWKRLTYFYSDNRIVYETFHHISAAGLSWTTYFSN